MVTINLSIKYLMVGFSSTEGITEYSELPEKAKEYIEFIEDFAECSASIISTGPSRDQTISK